MAHAARITEHSRLPRTLFKVDRPRTIDRHIDFFGTHGDEAPDMCGEALLDALTGTTRHDEEEVRSCA